MLAYRPPPVERARIRRTPPGVPHRCDFPPALVSATAIARAAPDGDVIAGATFDQALTAMRRFRRPRIVTSQRAPAPLPLGFGRPIVLASRKSMKLSGARRHI